MSCNHFQLAMLVYNLNCWLMLFNREDGAKVETLALTPAHLVAEQSMHRCVL
jgi:hypothetical protein